MRPSPRRLKVGDRATAILTICAVVLTVTGCRRSPDTAAVEPAPRLTLPLVDGAPLFEENDAIVVEVFRDPAVKSITETREVEDDCRAWRIEVDGATYDAGTDAFERLARHLDKLGHKKLGPENDWLSDRTLIVRADGESPFPLIKGVLGAAALAGTPRVFFAVTAPPDGRLNAIVCPLPIDKAGGSFIDLEAEVSKREGDPTLSVVLGPTTRWNPPPVGRRVVDAAKLLMSVGSEGAEHLRVELRTRFRHLDSIRASEGNLRVAINLIVQVGPGIKWRSMAGFIHEVVQSGEWRIGFVL